MYCGPPASGKLNAYFILKYTYLSFHLYEFVDFITNISDLLRDKRCSFHYYYQGNWVQCFPRYGLVTVLETTLLMYCDTLLTTNMLLLILRKQNVYIYQNAFLTSAKCFSLCHVYHLAEITFITNSVGSSIFTTRCKM